LRKDCESIYMNVNNQFIVKHALALNVFFILNYFAWLVGVQSIAPVIFIGLLIYFCYFAVDSFKLKHMLPLLIILYLSLLSLGTVATSWDARSIWLFHAKRIFIDNSFFAQLDGYNICCHNDYPIMVPLLSASFAKLIGYWNEIFPKVSNVFFILPPLLIFYGYLKSNRWFIFLIIGIFYIIAKLLINGYMDGILTLYALSALIIFRQLREENYNNKLLFLLAVFHSCVLVSIKNEGIYLFSILLCCIHLVPLKQLLIFTKKTWVFLIPYLFWLIWKLITLHHNVYNSMEVGVLEKFNYQNNFFESIVIILSERISWENVTLIARFLFESKYYFFGLIAIAIHFIFRKKYNIWGNIDTLIVQFVFAYLIFLFLVYVFTPYDLFWHLKTSTTRTTLPIQLSCLFLFISMVKKLIIMKNITTKNFILKFF